VLSTEARVALTLRLLGGLTTEEIARAFLVPLATIAQRIVRAKRTLASERVPFEIPIGAERGARLSSVLEVIYLVFNEGYTATAGDDWMRPALCEEALRLARIVAELAPQEPEVLGLAARDYGALADCGVESCRRCRDGVWSSRRSDARRRAAIRAGAADVPSAPERARRSTRQAWPHRRSPPGVRAGGVAHT
jgi:hypothetical protein